MNENDQVKIALPNGETLEVPANEFYAYWQSIQHNAPSDVTENPTNSRINSFITDNLAQSSGSGGASS